MNNIYKTAMLGAFMAVALVSCDAKFETFETDGYTGAPAAIEASSVTSEALPGQIKIKWTVPDNPQYDYIQIKYRDLWKNEDVTKIVSKYTDSLLIDKTLQRLGDYTFTLQTFNANHEAGPVTEVKARSGAYPTSVTVKSKTEVKLTAEQLSTNAQEPTEGPIKNLIDNNVSTFFHTRWSSPQLPLPQYIEVDFNEEHQVFLVWTQNRQWSQACPSEVELQISNDKENWKTVSVINGLPTGGSEEYTSPYVQTEEKFKYFRYNVTKTAGNTSYFNLAEFKFYDVELSVYDPENESQN